MRPPHFTDPADAHSWAQAEAKRLPGAFISIGIHSDGDIEVELVGARDRDEALIYAGPSHQLAWFLLDLQDKYGHIEMEVFHFIDELIAERGPEFAELVEAALEERIRDRPRPHLAQCACSLVVGTHTIDKCRGSGRWGTPRARRPVE